MPRAKKDGKYINIYMDKKILEAAEEYSDKIGVPKTRIIEDAVKEYLEKRKDMMGDILNER